MTSIPTGLAINTTVAGDRTTANGFRKVLASLIKQTAAGVPQAGILYAPGTPLAVAGDAAVMAYHVSAGFAVTTRSNQGAYIVGSLTDVDVPTIAADSVNPRIDVIYIFQPDPELTDTGVARIDVVNGTPATPPQEPSIPAGALKLAAKQIDKGVTNTSGGAAFSGQPGFTGANTLWSLISGMPSTFAPIIGSASNQAVAGNDPRLTNARTPLPHTHPWSDITGEPATYAPSQHDRNGTAHSGILSIANGGTGTNSAASALSALGVRVTSTPMGAGTPVGTIRLW